MRIILTGATGYVGEGTLLELLKVKEVEKVLSVSRKPTGIKNEKLEEYLVPDFMQLKKGDSHFVGYDAVFFIAGITSVGTPKDVYVQISQEIPLHFADIMPDKKQMTFIYLSGAGTDPNGKQFWQKVKGKTEESIKTMGFKRAFAFRPAIMRWAKGQKRIQTMQYFFLPFYPLFRLMGQGNNMKEIALSLLTLTWKGCPKFAVNPKDISMLAREFDGNTMIDGLCNLDQKKYLEMCGVKSSSDLSEEQLFRYFLSGYGGMMNKTSARMVKSGSFGMPPEDRAKGIAMLRQAFDENKGFRICFVDGEGIMGGDVEPGPTHFEMELSDAENDEIICLL